MGNLDKGFNECLLTANDYQYIELVDSITMYESYLFVGWLKVAAFSFAAIVLIGSYFFLRYGSNKYGVKSNILLYLLFVVGLFPLSFSVYQLAVVNEGYKNSITTVQSKMWPLYKPDGKILSACVSGNNYEKEYGFRDTVVIKDDKIKESSIRYIEPDYTQE